jgi:hypothetical protein
MFGMTQMTDERATESIVIKLKSLSLSSFEEIKAVRRNDYDEGDS